LLHVNVSAETLERTKLSRVLQLISLRNSKLKPKIEVIVGNAEKASKAKATPPPQTKPANDITPNSKSKDEKKAPSSSTDSPKRIITEPQIGVKRPRANDSSASAGQPAKRVASASTTGSPKASGENKSNTNSAKRLTPGAAVKSTIPATTVVAAKAKVVAKPTNYSGLQSASRKTATAATTPAQKAALTVKKPSTTNATEPKKAFSFADTMANLLKPKEPELSSAKSTDDRPPESEEEKSKRLRKEARRSLRVRWKPDISLVSIRVFEHVPEEDTGHDSSMVKDAGDVHGEGRMFKQHKEMLDVEEDEDELPAEESLREWKLPSLIDFGSEYLAYAREKNFDPYGGGSLKPETPQKEADITRETTTLSAYYPDKSSIPDSPAEPFDFQSESGSKITMFAQPENPTILGRLKRFEPSTAYAQDLPVHQSFTVPEQLQLPPSQSNTQTPDLMTILNNLKSLNGQQQQQQQTQLSAPQAPSPFPDLGSLLGNIGQPAAAPVIQPPPPQPITQPAPDLSSILAQLQNSQAQQHQSTAPVAPQPTVTPPPTSWVSQAAGSQTYPTFDANALQALFQQANSQSQYANIGYGSTQAAVQSSTPNSQQQPQNQPYEDPDRKRYRDSGDDGGRGRKKFNKSHQPATDHPKKGTVSCRFWELGKCAKGDACTYRHDPR
jgi:hypothetical protein